MEATRFSRHRVLQVLVDDLRDGDRVLPLATVALHRRPGAAANEAELPALEQHAAIGRRKAPAAVSAIGDDLADRELADQRLALGFEIDADRQAL
jgi:hypothetical protein